MTTFFSATRNFWNDEEGVTAIEYGLIAALVGVAIIGSLTTLRQALIDTFAAISDALTGK